MDKKQFYEYAKSLGIKINDAQRLMMLAEEVENKETNKIQDIDVVLLIEAMCIESLPPDLYEKWEGVKSGLIKSRKELNEEMFKNK